MKRAAKTAAGAGKAQQAAENKEEADCANEQHCMDEATFS
jgi:hypothetical protein